jgi:trans-aconitate 2-methyltransferase
MSDNQWNTSLYENKHGFVWQYGEELLDLLSPQVGERILDLGCGTGQLTEKIALAVGATSSSSTIPQVEGIDYSSTMIEKAKENYPHIQFTIADARNFHVDQPFDAIFSNAALHWIKQPDAVIGCVYQALKPGGRFVAEFGGKGNVSAIANSLYNALAAIGCPVSSDINPWYFPSIGEYATLLEKQDFNVTLAVLFDRPTPLEDGDGGMANWIEMFASNFLLGLSVVQQLQVIRLVEENLKPTLYRDGRWFADYRRIRVVAIK